jgi:hypothetical protein
MYLGTFGGAFTIVVQSVSEADTILSKNYYTSGPNSGNGALNNLLAQLLATKFASVGNGAYVPPFVVNAINIADNYLAITDGLTVAYTIQKVEDPDNPGVFYNVAQVLELYNNPNDLAFITSIEPNTNTTYVRADQFPAWPLENCVTK